MEPNLYDWLVSRLCQSPDTCLSHCSCSSVSQYLNDIASVWKPFQKCSTIHRNYTVPQSVAAYRNKTTQHVYELTVDRHREDVVNGTTDKAKLVHNTRTKYNEGANKYQDNYSTLSKTEQKIIMMHYLQPAVQALHIKPVAGQRHWIDLSIYDNPFDPSGVFEILTNMFVGYKKLVINDPQHHWLTGVLHGDEIDPAGMGLPLWGMRYNPLGVVLQMCLMCEGALKPRPNLLLEYILNVCISFYCTCNGRWMVKDVDVVNYNESNSEYIAVFVPEYDFQSCQPRNIENIYEELKTMSFAEFLSSVMHHLLNNAAYAALVTKANIESFLSNKVNGSYVQTFEILRWMIHPIHELQTQYRVSREEAISIGHEQIIVDKWTTSKFHKSGSIVEIYGVNTKKTHRIPVCYSHVFFDPYNACVKLSSSFADAWREQQERSIDLLVLGLTWWAATDNATMSSSSFTTPTLPKKRTRGSDPSPTSSKTESAREIAASYTDDYEEKVSALARNVESPTEDEEKVAEVEAVNDHVQELLAKLSICVQQDFIRDFRTELNVRFTAFRYLPVSSIYNKKALSWQVNTKLWPAVPRYKHPQTMYMESDEEAATPHIYIPAICQPKWEGMRKQLRLFPHDWYPPVNTITGMSPGAFVWNIKRVWTEEHRSGNQAIMEQRLALYDEAPSGAIWRRLSKAGNYYWRRDAPLSLVDEWFLQQWIAMPAECNRYVAWRALEILLQDESLVALAIYTEQHGAEWSEAAARLLWKDLQSAYEEFTRRLFQSCERVTSTTQHARIKEFFTKLHKRYTYGEAVVPTRDDLSILVSKADIEWLAKKLFPGLRTFIDGREVTQDDEAYDKLAAGAAPWSEGNSIANHVMYQEQYHNKRISLNAFYNRMQVEIFNTFVLPPLLMWYMCMAPDGVIMHDGDDWLHHLVNDSLFTDIVTVVKNIQKDLAKPRIQQLMRRLTNVASSNGTSLDPSLSMALHFAQTVSHYKRSKFEDTTNQSLDVWYQARQQMVHSAEDKIRVGGTAAVEEAWHMLELYSEYSHNTIADMISRWIQRECNVAQLEHFLAMPAAGHIRSVQEAVALLP
jgi:hypothetical protein